MSLTFDCKSDYPTGLFEQGVLSLDLTISGTWTSISIDADVLSFDDGMSISGTLGIGNVLDGLIVFGDITISGDATFGPVMNNWVKWSAIGSIDFTIGNANVAGERPMDWLGNVYKVKKFTNGAIVYGSGGISNLIANGNTYGLKTFNRVGILGKYAVTGTDTEHFFIDSKGVLWSLGEKGLDKLDYSEFLSEMTNPVMMFDEAEELVYICDGTLGYVYSIRDKSLGSGPISLTGLEYNGGTAYLVSSVDPPATPVFEIVSDIIDMSSRKNKTISKIELGLSTTQTLYAAVYFRTAPNKEFASTEWVPVGPDGSAYINCFGQEFKIRVKGLTYEYIELDYIRINGMFHDYIPTDVEERL